MNTSRFEMMQNVIQAITMALKGNRRLRIRGYRNSKGEVKDLEVELIGAAGYRELVRQSLEAMKTGTGLTFSPQNPEHADITPEVCEQARREQAESWTTTLQGHEPAPGAGLGYSTPMDRPLAVKLEYLRRINRESLVLTAKSPVAKVKQMLQHALPVGQFIGAVILEPGKFDSVEPMVDAVAMVRFEDYQDRVLRFEAPCEKVFGLIADQRDKRIRLIHSALGVTSEVVELMQQSGQINAIGECGDLFWFLGCGAKGLGITFQPYAFYDECEVKSRPPNYNIWEKVVITGELEHELVKAAGAYADHVKAVAFYDKQEFKLGGASPEVKIPAATQLQLDIMNLVVLVVRYCKLVLNVHPEQVLAANDAKLTERNKGKAFNREATLNRDEAREDAKIAAAAGV